MPCTKLAVACGVPAYAANDAKLKQKTVGGHAAAWALADVIVIAAVPAPSRLEVGAEARARVNWREPLRSLAEPPTAVLVAF